MDNLVSESFQKSSPRRISRKKKRRGLFYTPSEISVIMAEWCIRTGQDVVLEPSFGGCGFIEAAVERMRKIGVSEPLKQIFGCDIEKGAFTYLRNLAPTHDTVGRFLHSDFLALKPSDFGSGKVTCIIGNPPYVSYHNMYLKQRTAALAVGSDESFKVSGMASLWAYFVFHSLRFLGADGRMAWLLPSSTLHSNYGKRLLNELGSRFRRVGVISMRERVFQKDKTDETSEILLCDGFLGSDRIHSRVEIFDAQNTKRLEEHVRNWDTGPPGARLNGHAAVALTGANALKEYHSLADSKSAVSLAEISTLRIGIVTGLNRFFVVNEQIAGEHLLPDSVLRYIFAKVSSSFGVELTRSDLDQARTDGKRCLLVHVDGKNENAATDSYLDRFPKRTVTITSLLTSEKNGRNQTI